MPRFAAPLAAAFLIASPQSEAPAAKTGDGEVLVVTHSLQVDFLPGDIP